MLYCTGFFFIVIFLYLCFFFFCFFFFFSSRRRHTRCSRDWSSDVCSSDLLIEANGAIPCGPYPGPVARAIFNSAKWLIRSNGQPLMISTESADASRDRKSVV